MMFVIAVMLVLSLVAIVVVVIVSVVVIIVLVVVLVTIAAESVKSIENTLTYSFLIKKKTGPSANSNSYFSVIELMAKINNKLLCVC